MKIEVAVRQKTITVDCGDGSQTLQWLADSSVLLYDQTEMMTTGQAKGIKMGHTSLALNETIKSILKDGSQVRILLNEDIPEPKVTKRK